MQEKIKKAFWKFCYFSTTFECFYVQLDKRNELRGKIFIAKEIHCIEK